jgi:hypothetical protein
MTAKNIYNVIIFYREPTYELYHGDKDTPYQFTYEVEAADEEKARASAIFRFNKTADKSHVHWSRRVVNIIASIKPARQEIINTFHS